MKIIDIIRTANGNVRRSKLRTLLTVLAIVVGAFTLSLTNALGNGARSYIDRELQNIGSKNSLSIYKKPAQRENPFSGMPQKYDPQKVEEFGADYFSVDKLDEIKEITGAIKVAPIYQVFPEYVTTGGEKYVAQLNTYSPDLVISLSAGRLPNGGDANAVLIPQGYATVFFGGNEAAIGQQFTVVAKEPAGDELKVEVEVVGVLAKSVVFSNQMFGSEDVVRQLADFQTRNIAKLQGKIQTAVALLPEGTSEERIKEIVRELDAKGYRGATLEDQINSFKDAISTAQMILNLFGAIALLAASFGIINTLLMSVYERTREIGLLKALGANKRLIFAIFSVEAISIGFWGGIIGTGLSIIAGSIINSFAAESFLRGIDGFRLLTFPPSSVLMVLLLIMGIAFIAGALPARKASRMNPVDALRYE